MAKKPKVESKFTPTKRQLSRWQREKRRQHLTIAIGLAVIVSVLGLVGWGVYDTQVRPWHETVIKVEDTTFDMGYYVGVLRLYGAGGNPQYDRSVADRVTGAIETNELVAQLARRLDITVAPSEVDEKVKSLILGPGGEGEYQELYQERLEMWKLSDEEFRGVIESELLHRKLIEEVIEPIVPREYQGVHVRGILVYSEEEAEVVMDRLNDGENFADLAGELSQHSISGDEGGDLGWLPRGIVGSEFDRVAFSIEPHEISSPIPGEGGVGYWVIEVLERDAEDEKSTIDDTYWEMLVGKKYEGWFSEQTESIVVEDYLDSDKIAWALEQASKD